MKGWVNVDDLLAGLRQRKRWRQVTIEDLASCVGIAGQEAV